MSKLHVAVLRGGPSNLYDSSLMSGASVLRHLPEKYHGHDIFIDRSGAWHRDGVERTPDRALAGIDAVINALRGTYGEDGKVQKILDHFSIPYTGSNAIASAVAHNKALTKQALEQHGIKTPYYAVIKNTDNRQEKEKYIFHHFYLPLVVKPTSSAASIGVTIVKDFRQLANALDNAFTHSESVIVEEYIRGRETVAGILENFRGQRHYTLLPAEIRYPEGDDHFTAEAKSKNLAIEYHPGNFSDHQKAEIQRIAKQVHEIMGLRHYSTIDMIVTPTRGIFVLEVNPLPHLHDSSTLARSLDAVGARYPEFLELITQLALAGV